MSLLFVPFPVILIPGSWLSLPSRPGWGWGGRETFPARAQVPQQLLWLTSLLFSFTSVPEGAGCQLSPALPSKGSRSAHLQVLLTVNSKKNLRNFFLIGPFSPDFAYLSALSPWQTPWTVTQGHGLSMGRKLWPWAQSERIWLSGVSCGTAKLQRWGPDKVFQRRILHRHCVSVSIVSSCFSWCLLWWGWKWPLHGKHLPSGARIK